MLKITLFFLLIVVGSVSSLKCKQMDASKCNKDVFFEFFAECLIDHTESRECESPKVCITFGFFGENESYFRVLFSTYLKGCGLKNNCKEDLIKPLLGDNADRWIGIGTTRGNATLCRFCETDDCNAVVPKKAKSLLKGSKNSTAAPAPKKSGGIRRHNRITMQQIMSIFILLLLFTFF